MQIKIFDTFKAGIVAHLHISGISTGFISSLGVGFVTALYEAISEDQNSFCFVAQEDEQVLGFVAFSCNLGKLYKYVLKRKFFRFAPKIAFRMLNFTTFKKVVANLLYPSKMSKMDLPDAELLSIVVAPEGRGRGVASELTRAGFDECRRRGINRVKVLVAADNEPANRLYQKVGFKFHSQIESHGVLSNVYVVELGIRN
ncbi:putative acetyltransferase [Limihaloglobus sulfuriphilus]|uniref:Putative acetyltransferase n=1 Tax=Limihaloglobus sulfuriphilus TaxID=1851148 RepID=A0A1Q2MFM8_9BACT|nr:N-acetyltransferase [Limihaloglobus sulfuriphilus]AQQ71501.1 putative acetyltransferase [Limihaloglobus sulfuriphilus]